MLRTALEHVLFHFLLVYNVRPYMMFHKSITAEHIMIFFVVVHAGKMKVIVSAIAPQQAQSHFYVFGSDTNYHVKRNAILHQMKSEETACTFYQIMVIIFTMTSCFPLSAENTTINVHAHMRASSKLIFIPCPIYYALEDFNANTNG